MINFSYKLNTKQNKKGIAIVVSLRPGKISKTAFLSEFDLSINIFFNFYKN
jgi:hypothetical protein